MNESEVGDKAASALELQSEEFLTSNAVNRQIETEVASIDLLAPDRCRHTDLHLDQLLALRKDKNDKTGANK